MEYNNTYNINIEKYKNNYIIDIGGVVYRTVEILGIKSEYCNNYNEIVLKNEEAVLEKYNEFINIFNSEISDQINDNVSVNSISIVINNMGNNYKGKKYELTISYGNEEEEYLDIGNIDFSSNYLDDDTNDFIKEMLEYTENICIGHYESIYGEPSKEKIEA